MNEKKVFIHIGLQKTASTYLQTEFFPDLKNVEYVGRPYTQESLAFNTLQYTDDILYDRAIVEKEMRSIIGNMGEKNTLLISDEIFSGFAFYASMNRSMIATRLKEVLPSAEIILFLRNQEELILSLYNQFLKTARIDFILDKRFLYLPGEGLDFKSWNPKSIKWSDEKRFIQQRAVYNVEHFRYSKTYDFYNGLFNKVHIFLYEDFKNDQIGSLKRLASILSTEVPSELLDTNKKTIVNKRMGPHRLHRKLLQNRFAHVTPLANSIIGKIIFAFFALFMRDHRKKNQEYVRSVLHAAGIYKDNLELDQKADLGMKRYAKKYFGK